MPQVRRHRLGVDGLGEMEVPPLPLRQLLQPDVPDEAGVQGQGRAESEAPTPTLDPSGDPDTMRTLPRMSRRQRRAAAAASRGVELRSPQVPPSVPAAGPGDKAVGTRMARETSAT